MSYESALRWATAAAQAADAKKGDDVVILAVGPVLAITEYFVIASAPNSRLVRSIAEAVEEDIKLLDGPSPQRVEGMGDLTWVLLDYGEFVVHVFSEETRRFYDLERLWKDMIHVPWERLESSPAR